MPLSAAVADALPPAASKTNTNTEIRLKSLLLEREPISGYARACSSSLPTLFERLATSKTNLPLSGDRLARLALDLKAKSTIARRWRR
ncbi:MAG: hypothetical protein ABI726_10090 [bacterium]